VALRTEAYYRAVAAAALEKIGAGEPPVSLDAIVSSLAIPLRSVNLPLFFTAAMVYEDGMPVMILNWAQPEPERRAALGHMLGHVLLVLQGDGNTYPRDAADHGEADLVAKELLMPTGMVIDQARLWFNDYRYLARLFGVTEEQMLDRMREMGLVKGSSGISWDY
jgi:Zn-dependent peptidase ImmA (M78 family)